MNLNAIQPNLQYDFLRQVSHLTAHSISRRTFLALSPALPWALRADAASSIPDGLERFSVRKELYREPRAAVRAVAKMGYECVEFYAPDFEWSEAERRQIREL